MAHGVRFSVWDPTQMARRGTGRGLLVSAVGSPLLTGSALSPTPCRADLRMEGLFRVPGNSLRQQILKDALNSGVDIDLESGEFHSNDVASLLKMFLGELPEPLLTHKHFQAHLKIAGE
ncbi:Rho GTPase activating protein 19 [Chelydra serpentina]|uniref:Rho GTPase activating protein 19 n=1 Tax=Chelydra serpentina TaxID=8475 RepID=A0A8T1RXJ9_CHESE|nr:Rho GTPase activating protein 19 [Chelydra serpentina]